MASNDDATAGLITIGIITTAFGIGGIHWWWKSRRTLGPTLCRHLRVRQLNDVLTIHRIFPDRFKADLHFGLESVLQKHGKAQPAIGFSGGFRCGQYVEAQEPTPLVFEELDIGEERPVQCLTAGMWLATVDDLPCAIFKTPEYNQSSDDQFFAAGVRIDIVVPPAADLQRLSDRVFK